MEWACLMSTPNWTPYLSDSPLDSLLNRYFACKYSNYFQKGQIICRVPIRMSHDGVLTVSPHLLRARYTVITLLTFSCQLPTIMQREYRGSVARVPR